MQDELSLVYREEEREMLPLCRADGIGVIPWSPLGGRKLTRPWGERTNRSSTDRYNKSLYDEDAPDEQAVVDAVADLARARGVSMAQVALAWVMRQPGITAPIVGASKVSHVEDALAAAALVLSDEDAAGLEAPRRPHVPRGFSCAATGPGRALWADRSGIGRQLTLVVEPRVSQAPSAVTRPMASSGRICAEKFFRNRAA